MSDTLRQVLIRPIGHNGAGGYVVLSWSNLTRLGRFHSWSAAEAWCRDNGWHVR